MMYLVYTALLALNVSAEILDGFVTVGDAMNQSNENIAVKLDDSYSRFQAAYVNNPEKVQDQWNKAQNVQKLSNELKLFIDSTQCDFLAKMQKKVTITNHETNKGRDILIVDASGKTIYDSARTALNEGGLGIIDAKDNVEVGTNFFYGTSEEPDGAGVTLKNRIIDYKKKLKQILGSDSSNLKIGLDVESEHYSEHEGKSVSWEFFNFHRTIAISDMVLLSRLKAEIMNAEFDAVNNLYAQISADDFKFDHVQALVIPKSTYVMQGNRFEADIFVGAYDSKAKLSVEIGGQRLEGDSVVHYAVGAGGVGPKKYSGNIYVKKDNSDAKAYSFSGEYFVAQPAAVVSLTNMNVVYSGIDNPVRVSVPGANTRDVVPSIKDGSATITRDPEGKEGDYIIKTTQKAGKIHVQISAKMDGKMQAMGVEEYRVRTIPDPVIKISKYKNGESIPLAELRAQSGIKAAMENFEFKMIAPKVISYSFNYSNSGKSEIMVKGSNLSPEVKSALAKVKAGNKIYFDDIVVKLADGSTRKYSATFKVGR
ncbi:MAG: hypothetical protein KBT45_00445 [Bacteroidales bacterium]|nr:hypothetical protein [Candidatus Colimorpha pelethequi]MCQ2261547.1 hypothetical protein [Bacteroidales bacterium]